MPQTNNLTPPRIFRGTLLFWACIAVGFAAVVAYAALVFVSRIHVPDRLLLRGVLVPQRTIQQVVVPAQIPILKVLVAEGASVESDQKLLRIDDSALQAEVDTLTFHLRRNQTMRNCLLDSNMTTETAPAETADVADPGLSLNATDIEQQTTLKECRLRHQKAAIARAALRDDRNHLLRQAKLLRLQPPMTQEVDPEAATLQRAVALQNYETAARAIGLQLAALVTQQDQAIVESVKRLGTEIAEQEARLDRFSPYLSTPWIIAPIPGVVDKLRVGPDPHTFDTDTTVMQILSSPLPELTASLELPPHLAERFAPGDKIHFRLAGLPLHFPAIPGKITSLKRQEGVVGVAPAVHLHTTLSPEDISDPQIRIRVLDYLSTFHGQSQVTVELADTPLLTHLSRATERIAPSLPRLQP